MRALRTPDDRFADLPDFGFEPRYVDIDARDGGGDTLRVHYVDEGPTGAAPVLLMHGEPSWSFLYRSMIPPLVAAGHRCIAPDLVGFGRSDKPAEPSDYSYARHVAWMADALFHQLDLSDITLFGHDWGGLIGLRLVAAEPERFARVIVANTGLPTGDSATPDAFLAWQKFAAESPKFLIGRIVAGGCVRELAPDVIAAYDAPFPDESYTAGARVFPSLVPTGPDDPAAADNRNAWKVLDTFSKPLLCAFSDHDPITKGGDRVFRRRVLGARDQPHTTIVGGGHFLQEDCGATLAQLIIDLVASAGSASRSRPAENR